MTKDEAKKRFDRVPQHGWDCAIDDRHANKWLREVGDTVGTYELQDLTVAGLEAMAKKYADDLKSYVVKLRRMGLRPRTTIKKLNDHFKGRIRDDGEPAFDIGLLTKLVFHVYTN